MKKYILAALLCLLPLIGYAYTPPQTATAPITLSTANVIACPTCATTSGVVTTWAGGTTGLLPSAATSGAVTVTGVLIGANGGTGVANTGKTFTMGGNHILSGAFASTFTFTNTTAVTFPVSGTLATTSQLTFGSLTGQATNAQLATQTANTVLGALTATTPSGLTVPSCSAASSALTWTTGTGFGCNTIAGGGSVTTVSVTTANGVSGTVATATTTPAITLTLGAITPSSVASTGAVSGTTGTFSSGINSTAIGATTPSTGAFTTLTASSTSAFTGNVGIGQAAGADKLDVTGDGNFTGILTATTGNVISSAGNGVFTVQGLESSGTGAGIRVRDSVLGTIGYLAQNSYVQGGTGYAQLDLQAAQGTGTVCIAGGGLGSTTPGTSCGILVGATNGVTLASGVAATPVTLGGHVQSVVGPSTAPTCGANCSSVTAGATDTRGTLTTGTGVSSIVLNFGTTFASTPVCVVNTDATPVIAFAVPTPTTTTLTITFNTAVTSTLVSWICLQ